MTVTITSSLRVGLVSGTGVTFNAPVVPFITTDDIFIPDNPSESLTDLIDGISGSRLLAVAVINAKTVGNTPLYTVPAGDIVFPTSVIFALTGISGSGDAPQINLGISGNFQEIIDSTRVPTLFDNITTIRDILSISDFTETAGNSGADYKYLVAASPITLRVAVGATYSTYMLKAYVFGLQVEAP